MPRKEVSVKHEDIRDPQTITKVVDKAFREKGLDMHRHEATHEDDHTRGTRTYKIKNVKYFGPWSHRG
jgi:hypothetical protein